MTSAAIAGLGMTELGKVYGRSATSLAAQAVRLAAADAGIPLSAVDGLLISSGNSQDVGIELANVLSTGPLDVLSTMNAFGATAGLMVATAAKAIAEGAATTVACVFADAPLKPKQSTGSAYGSPRFSQREIAGLGGWSLAGGATNPNILYAMCARRHME